MARIANRPLTKANDPHRFTDLAQVVAALLLLILPAFYYAAQRANKFDADRTVGQLESELLALEHERDVLELEVEQLLEPRGLALRAHEVAGLAPVAARQMVVIDPLAPAPDRILLTAETSDGHR